MFFWIGHYLLIVKSLVNVFVLYILIVLVYRCSVCFWLDCTVSYAVGSNPARNWQNDQTGSLKLVKTVSGSLGVEVTRWTMESLPMQTMVLWQRGSLPKVENVNNLHTTSVRERWAGSCHRMHLSKHSVVQMYDCGGSYVVQTYDCGGCYAKLIVRAYVQICFHYVCTIVS